MWKNCTIPPSITTTCVQPYQLDDSHLHFSASYLWWMGGVGSTTVASFGIIFNIIIIIVVLGSELAAHFFNWLLVCLAISDSFLLLNGVLEAFRSYFGSSQLHDYVFVYFLHYFRSAILCCSEYMTILLAVERYNALAKPEDRVLHQNQYITSNTLSKYFSIYWKRLVKYVCPIIVLSSLLYVPKMFESQVVEQEICERVRTNRSTSESLCYCWNVFAVRETDFRNNNLYTLWYLNVTNILVTVFIPIVSLIYLYFNIVLKFKKHRQMYPMVDSLQLEITCPIANIETLVVKENTMVEQTMMLFVIAVVFLVSHTPRSILNLEEFASMKYMEDAKKEGCIWLPYWTAIMVPISHILLQINSSVNLLICFFFNNQFRRNLKHKIRKLIPVSKCIKKRANYCKKKDQTNELLDIEESI